MNENNIVHLAKGESMNAWTPDATELTVQINGIQKSKKGENQDQDLDSLIVSCKIDLSEELSPPPVAMEIMSDNKPITLFTKGNFSIVTGAAKSRKSFLISMLMAAALLPDWFDDMFCCSGKGINLLFDTEQSRYKTQQIGKRIHRLTFPKLIDPLSIYSLRILDPQQRIAVIDKVLAETPGINFVAIDGIIDLDIDPILQADQAQRIVLKLMQWTEIYNIHIVCVLHYNKTVATLLGHLGSFSHRKADAIIEVSKYKDDESISIVKAVDCREKEFLPFAFKIDDSGLPSILRGFEIELKSKKEKPVKESKKKISPHDFDELVHQKILSRVFQKQKEFGYTELWRSIKMAVEEVGDNKIGDNAAKEFVTFYSNKGSVTKTTMENNKPGYGLPAQ